MPASGYRSSLDVEMVREEGKDGEGDEEDVEEVEEHHGHGEEFNVAGSLALRREGPHAPLNFHLI